MDILHIAILSVVQGLTEFLPVSSSGHLVLVPAFLGLADQGLEMDLAVHIGTLLAVLVYYRHDVTEMALAFLFWKDAERTQARRLGIYIVIASIPAVIVGYLIHRVVPEGIRSVHVITMTTIVFGLLMGIADRWGRRDRALRDMSLKSALLIGCAQALALIPGTSRSGITMTAARTLGFDRVTAARFSFLLSIPATAGAGLLGVLDVIKSGDVALGKDMAIAAALTFFAGILAIHFMMRWLKNFGLMPFVVYRLALGAVLLTFVL